MKTNLKSILLVLGLINLSIVGCSKKSENTVQPPIYNPNPLPINPIDPHAAANAQIETKVAQIKNANACTKGGSRIEVHFRTTASLATGLDVIQGPYQTGQLNGVVSNVYIGKSAFNDILIIRKFINGQTVLGFGIEMSMCPYDNLITPGRQLSDLMTPNGIIIDIKSSCVIGDVLAASFVQLTAAAYNSNINGQGVQLQAYPFHTSFASFSSGSCSFANSTGNPAYGGNPANFY